MTLTLGVQDGVKSALAIIAKKRGLFARQGLNVEFKEHSSDEGALKSLVNEEVDVAFSSTIPFVIESFNNENLRLLAGTGFTDKAHVVLVKRENGESNPRDLAGQTVGTVADSAVSIFLQIFLKIHDVKGVKVEYLDEDVLIEKFLGGELEAIAIRTEKYEEILEGSETRLRVYLPDFFRLYGILASSEKCVTQKREALKRFMGALVLAEKFVYRNPDRSQKIIFDYFGTNRLKSISNDWESYRYILSLGESLLLALESAQKLYKENHENERTVKFLPLIESEILREEKPYAVTIRQ